MENYENFKPDPNDEFYVDLEDGSFGVFGTESGFCYGLYSDRADAEKHVKEHTEARGYNGV